MLDRESTFSDPRIVELLQTKFIPVAIDQAYQRRQQDGEGEYYRKIAGQGPRNNFNGTTQGLYIATADGKLLVYNNNRGPDRIERLMRRALEEFRPVPTTLTKLGRPDPRWGQPTPPDGGLVVQVTSKVLAGYEKTDDHWRNIFQSALGLDNLWIRKDEHEALLRGNLSKSLLIRLARFHLVDNTRGEPPMWQPEDIRNLDLSITDGRVIKGTVHLETKSGNRGYQAKIVGVIESKGNKVVRFDIVSKGQFWGEGRYTRGAPKGKFPFAVAFKLAAKDDVFAKVPPQGSRGWMDGYIK